jgi:hypothetical protein
MQHVNVEKVIGKHHPNHLFPGTELTMMSAYLEIWIQSTPLIISVDASSCHGPSLPFDVL